MVISATRPTSLKIHSGAPSQRAGIRSVGSSHVIRSSGPSVVNWSKMKVLKTGLNLNDRIVLVFLIPAPQTVRKMVSVWRSYSSLKISPFPLKKMPICLCGKIFIKKRIFHRIFWEYSVEYSVEYSGEYSLGDQSKGATWAPSPNLKWRVFKNFIMARMGFERMTACILTTRFNQCTTGFVRWLWAARVIVMVYGVLGGARRGPAPKGQPPYHMTRRRNQHTSPRLGTHVDSKTLDMVL